MVVDLAGDDDLVGAVARDQFGKPGPEPIRPAGHRTGHCRLDRGTDLAQRDIDRVQSLWRDLRGRFGEDGPFLCGRFGIVDAMYAPVVIRFRGYGVKLDATAEAYCASMLGLEGMREWVAAGVAEPERLDKYESLA